MGRPPAPGGRSSGADRVRPIAGTCDRQRRGRHDHGGRRQIDDLSVDGQIGRRSRHAGTSAPDKRGRGERQNGRTQPVDLRTDEEPLPGGESTDLSPFLERGLEVGLPANTVDHLVRAYGTEAAGIYNLGAADRRLFRPLAPPHPAIEAEIIHAVRRELAQTVADVLVRRLHLYHERPDYGVPAARRTAELMGRELAWDDARIDRETSRYLDLDKAARARRRRAGGD
jgi:glycerol-3-phosphate dehydrogenase